MVREVHIYLSRELAERAAQSQVKLPEAKTEAKTDAKTQVEGSAPQIPGSKS
jgi:hypothetical protein